MMIPLCSSKSYTTIPLPSNPYYKFDCLQKCKIIPLCLIFWFLCLVLVCLVFFNLLWRVFALNLEYCFLI